MKPLLLLAAQLVALIAVAALAGTQRLRWGTPVALTILVIHMIMLATIGVVLGPLLLLPILIFGSMPIMITAPTIYLPKTIVVGHFLAVAVPLALEHFKIVPHSFSVKSGSLVLHPWAIDITPSALTFVVLGTIGLQLVANSTILARQRRAQERQQELLHVQKWQLQQLVPSSGSRPM